MTKEIDTGTTERDLFELILSDEAMNLPDYDPAKHLHPREAAVRWNISETNARERLRRDKRLTTMRVRNPETHVEMTVFVPAKT